VTSVLPLAPPRRAELFSVAGEVVGLRAKDATAVLAWHAQKAYTVAMAKGWTLTLGTLADHDRFKRRAAQAMDAYHGLSALEAMRRAYYDDPENPPRLERVFVLFAGPQREICGRGGLRSGDVG